MSTIGYDVEPHEIEGLLAEILDGLPDDDLICYHALTREQAVYDKLVSAIKVERGRRLARLREGRTLGQVAEVVGLGTRQRVADLIDGATAAMSVATVHADPAEPVLRIDGEDQYELVHPADNADLLTEQADAVLHRIGARRVGAWRECDAPGWTASVVRTGTTDG